MNSSAPAKVLITGATGFIGRHCLAPMLGRAWEVHAVTSGGAAQPQSSVTWHRANLLELSDTARLIEEVRPTHLLHLAWDLPAGEWRQAGGHVKWLQASLELLERFAAAGGTRVVMAGTCAEYDWRYGYCSEYRTPVNPATLYGAAKHALGTVLEAFSRQGGLSAAWARVFFVYGPHEHPDRLVASVIRSLLANQPAPCTHGRQLRDFLYVTDVAEALVALLDSGVSGPVNVGSGQPVPVADLARRIGTQFGRLELIHLGARPAPADEAPLVVADVRRLQDEVRWAPRFSLDEGLAETIAWWRGRLDAEMCGVK